MLGFGTLKRVLGEIRADVASARDRDPAARGVGTAEILMNWAGVQAILAHRVAHALHEAGRAWRPDGALLHEPRRHRGRDPPGGADRRRVLHRPRVRRRDRRDGRDRRPRDALSGRHPRRDRLRARQAPPDGRGRRHDRLRREAARPDHGRPAAPRSARTRSSISGRAPPTPRWSAIRATRSASRAAGSRAPTPTGSTCRTRSPTRSRPSRSGSRELEERLGELDGKAAEGEVRELKPKQGPSSAGG